MTSHGGGLGHKVAFYPHSGGHIITNCTGHKCKQRWQCSCHISSDSNLNTEVFGEGELGSFSCTTQTACKWHNIVCALLAMAQHWQEESRALKLAMCLTDNALSCLVMLMLTSGMITGECTITG